MAARKNRFKDAASLTQQDKELISVLHHSKDAMLIVNPDGIVVGINPSACHLLNMQPEDLVNVNIDEFLPKTTYSDKRNLVRVRRAFNHAKSSCPYDAKWLTFKKGKPVQAFLFSFYPSRLDESGLILIRIRNIIEDEMVEWVLTRLANLDNHGNINAVIDEVLTIAMTAFSLEHACVSMLDDKARAHTISLFENGVKQANMTYSLEGTPCAFVQSNPKTCHYNDGVHALFPNDHYINDRKIEAYLGEPLFGSKHHIIGIFSLMSTKSIEINQHARNILHLLSNRISLELECLMSQRKLQFLASIPKQDPNPVMRMLPDGHVIYANAKAKSMLTYWQEIHGNKPEKLLLGVRKALQTGQIVQEEVKAFNKVFLLTMVWIPEFNHVNVYGSNITKLKEAEENILNLARFDALTELANRQFFEEKISAMIDDGQATGQVFALLLIDLDGFKPINDTLGHHIGDKLLQAVAKRMQRSLREDDFLARLGGDEFVILLNKSSADGAIVVAEKINQVLSKPFQFGEYRMDISCSIGVALFPEAGLATSDLLRHADIAMYQAKRAGKNNWALFSQDQQEIIHKRRDIIQTDLKNATANNEMFLEYQPQFDLSSGNIIGLEALMRWEHPEFGFIPPNEFVALAEHIGMMSILGQWVLEQAVTEFSHEMKDLASSKLFMNVTPAQLSDARFLDIAKDCLNTHGLSADRLVIEVSESLLAHNFKIMQKELTNLHEHGIKLCLDNFGGPQLSLSRLVELPFDYIKLDQKLINHIDEHQRYERLLKGVLDMANHLNIIVIQKGIEDEAQNEYLKKLGFHFGQGYLLAQPDKISKIKKHFNLVG